MSTKYGSEDLLEHVAFAGGLCTFILTVISIVGIIMSAIILTRTNKVFAGLCLATHATVLVSFLLLYFMMKGDNYRFGIAHCQLNKCNHSITMMVHMFLIVMIVMMASFTAGRMRKPIGAVEWAMDIILILQIIALWVYSFVYMGASLTITNPTKVLNSLLNMTTTSTA